jgi:glucan phosphoethanolaminetransferase (alkaline phosphatase superfamily)
MDYIQAGGALPTGAKSALANISKFDEVWDIPLLFFSILTVDVIVLFLARYYGVGGKSLNKWYDAFGIAAVLADVLVILIGFFIARWVYSTWLQPRFGWNAIYFVLLLVGVQVIHDILFYFLVIRPLPQGHNEMIDVFKAYADENGGAIISGDAVLMISSALVAMILKAQPVATSASVFTLASYALPYILYTEPQYAKKLSKPVEAPAKVAKQ